MRHIGIGRTHARTPVIVLIQDHNVHVINATTGEVLRELTIDPTRDYQLQKQRKLPNPFDLTPWFWPGSHKLQRGGVLGFIFGWRQHIQG